MRLKNNFTCLFFGFIIFWGCLYWSSASAADENDLVPVQEEAKKGGYGLIDVDSLWQLYQDDKENLILVNTRQEWEYHAGYIQSAANFSMEPTWLSRLTSRGALEQFLGPDKNKTFVFY